MRLAVALVSAAALLAALAGQAQAKQLASARACDGDGCRTITAAAALRGMEEGEPASAPERGAPFYRVHMRVGLRGRKDFRYTLLFLPSAGLLRVRGQFGEYDWLATTPRGQRAFERLTRGLAPLPARRLRGLAVTLPPAPVPDTGGFPWTLLPGAIGAGALLLGAAAWAARRRAGPPASADIAASRSR